MCYGFNLDNILDYASKKYRAIEERQQILFNELVKLCESKNIKLDNIDSYNPKLEYAHGAIYRMLPSDFLEKNNITCTGDLYRLSSIDSNFPLYIDMHIVWPDITELVEIIHKNNGKVFIAHPYRYNKDVLDVLKDVKNYVDGIEICNNPNSKEEVEFLYKYAKDNNLLISCGSDYHGDSKHSLDCNYLTDEMINDILLWIK